MAVEKVKEMMTGSKDSRHSNFQTDAVFPTMTEMIAEAIERMKMLGLSAEIINDFQKDGRPSFAMENGKRSPLETSEKQQIQKMADSEGELVYAVIRNDSLYGRKITAFLMVNRCNYGWLLERDLIAGPNFVTAYIYDSDSPAQSKTWPTAFKRFPEGMLDLRIACDY